VSAECDGVALFRAGERERSISDLPDEPVSDVCERIDPEEFRATVAEQRDLDREPVQSDRLRGRR
jgi:hypothetical protein